MSKIAVSLPFKNRQAAGSLLADALTGYRGATDAGVLGLARGGVPVAFEVARKLQLTLDVVVTRKLGVPWQPELAFGAVGPTGVTYLDSALITSLGISQHMVEAISERETQNVRSLERRLRAGLPTPDFNGCTVIIVDDGIATGATMMAAVRGSRTLGAQTVVVAAPVASEQACESLQNEADGVICLAVPRVFYAVGLYYNDFEQVDDTTVRNLLASAQLESTHQ